MFLRALSLLAFFALPAMAQDHVTSSPETQAKIAARVADGGRPGTHKARDRWRHPAETLAFFGIEPGMTAVEIWPGGQGGFYRRILEPLIGEGGGRYIPVTQGTPFPDAVPGLPYGAVDMVLVFRAHGFMIYNHPAQDYVDALYAMLRPGGILGIVDHAGDEAVPQDPKGENGYVNESHFRAMAEKAGFRLIAESAINRNPRDTKNHPRGVYSLPPTLAGTLPTTEERQKFLDIGESDRFTLKFIKPAE